MASADCDLRGFWDISVANFGALKRVHEAFAARNKSWQMAGGPKSTRCGLPHVLATHVISKNELHLLIDETGMLGGGLNRTMADVIFARCSLRTLQQVASPNAPSL